jgi:hypothetical protein
MPRQFRKSALRSAPSETQHLTLEPASGRPPQQPNAPAARPDVVVATRCVLACRASSTARCVPCCRRGEQTARRVNKGTYMGTVLLHGFYTKGSDGHPSSTASIVIDLLIRTFRSGAEGIRTPDLRRAKGAKGFSGASWCVRVRGLDTLICTDRRSRNSGLVRLRPGGVAAQLLHGLKKGVVS